MGRTEKSQGLAPPSVRKDIRAKQARHIINKVIPTLLTSNPRARKGAEGSELIVSPEAWIHAEEDLGKVKPDGNLADEQDAAFVKRKGQGRRKAKHAGGSQKEGASRAEEESSHGKKKNNSSVAAQSSPISASAHVKKRIIRIVTTDTLTAAHMLTFPLQYQTTQATGLKHPKKSPNVCVLNMASPLRPGGGVLTGATSQEEFLCARTTLLPSLREELYRLPDLGGIYTSDVLVFRSALPLGDGKGELLNTERYYVDIISAGMLRFPELEGGDEEVKRLSRKDRTMVEAKMRAVLRIAARKGAKNLVLGAWGCGAYGMLTSALFCVHKT